MAKKDNRSQELIFRSHLDDPFKHSMALACGVCPLRSLCGGLSIREPIMGCMDFCCGDIESCTTVCRNKAARYVSQLREIHGFPLENIPRTPVLNVGLENGSIPLIYHGSRRQRPLARSAVAIRLSDLANFRLKQLNFSNREQLCEAFKIEQSSEIILTGVNHDKWVEPWWTLGDARRRILSDLSKLNIKLLPRLISASC